MEDGETQWEPRQAAVSLAREVDMTHQRIREMERHSDDIFSRLNSMNHAFSEEINKIQLSAREHFQRISIDHEKFKLQLEHRNKELELQGIQLEKREVANETRRKKLAEEIEENAAKNSSLRIANLKRLIFPERQHRKDDVSVMKLADDHKREMEQLHKIILSLEKQLESKQAIELEIECLKAQLNVTKHMGDDDLEVKVENIHKDLQEKEEELKALESLNQVLAEKDRKNNVALQEALKELIEGFKFLPKAAHIRVRKMGDLEIKPFYDAMKQKYNETEAQYRALELWSLWEEYLRDPNWHPFKIMTINGEPQAVIVKYDGKLKGLKRDLTKDVYKAVATALMEIHDYNLSGRYVTTELWNFSDARKATLQEGVLCLLKMWDAQKRRRITF